MKTYEVFLKRAGKDPFIHVGALEAPDDDLALSFARDCYARRSEGDQMWVVARDDLLVGDPVELEMADRAHRHNDGALLKDLRRADASSAS
ncbi:1,2-phenylacetyl-CoA epoxidase subunit B [Candidatus Poriferisodalis sp.]|uniref:1,2-phenylacetyl-CoA epoxidase subunit B n=1 Tax=Candidatus Poriferisodalis sp. TaxID=3101277 RepID=UPI003B01991F